MLPLDQGEQFIALPGIEGFSATPYYDGAGIATIGIGTIVYPSGARVTMRDPDIDRPTALRYLDFHLRVDAESVWIILKHSPTPNQWAALLSFTYNEGASALIRSNLMHLFNQNRIADCADDFLKWKYEHQNGNLVEVPGLLSRRIKERALFLTP